MTPFARVEDGRVFYPPAELNSLHPRLHLDAG
jgi:hypothetical protein